MVWKALKMSFTKILKYKQENIEMQTFTILPQLGRFNFVDECSCNRVSQLAKLRGLKCRNRGRLVVQHKVSLQSKHKMKRKKSKHQTQAEQSPKSKGSQNTTNKMKKTKQTRKTQETQVDTSRTPEAQNRSTNRKGKTLVWINGVINQLDTSVYQKKFWEKQTKGGSEKWGYELIKQNITESLKTKWHWVALTWLYSHPTAFLI